MGLGYLGAWLAWIKKGRLGWGSVALVVIGLLWLLVGPRTPDAVRQLGLLYELVGVLVVFYEIRKVSTKHGVDRLHKRVWRYMGEVPTRAPRTFNLDIHEGIHAHASVTADLQVSYGVSAAESTADQRLAKLEARANALEAGHKELRRGLTREETARETAVRREGEERLAADRELMGRIVEAETGGLDLSFFGVWWLLIGMVLTTGTQEVCRWPLRCIG